MNAYVDPDLCIGCTQCAGLCPAVFHMEGVLAVAEPGPIPPEEVPQAVDAANACPVSAIRIEEYTLDDPASVFYVLPALAGGKHDHLHLQTAPQLPPFRAAVFV